MPQRGIGSFRDPSGFVFTDGGELLRQVNLGYRDNYDYLFQSGLYDALVKEDLLIPHVEVDPRRRRSDSAYVVIKPELIPFVSYPYEWSFSQLKSAALHTLEIQKIAIRHRMSLKDCSAYNIQFRNGRPVFIDTLSFEHYEEGVPWNAFRQFCQHFLAPLAIMSLRDVRLGQLLRSYVDGIPLDLASSLLPYRSWFSLSLLLNIHLHAGTQKRYAHRPTARPTRKIGRRGLMGIIDNLQSGVENLSWRPMSAEWGNYYEETNYSPEAMDHKKEIVARFLKLAAAQTVWDLGANTGLFSRIASNRGVHTVSFDADPAAVETNYLESVERGDTHLLPLLLDLTNPSANMGWANNERKSLLDRGPADTVLALALVHHLAISNNTPLQMIAAFLTRISRSLIIEFVPKSDSQVQRLLQSREDIFPNYDEESFREVFGRYFALREHAKITGSERTIYFMERAETAN